MVLISVFKNIEVHNLTYSEFLHFILVIEQGDQLSNVEFDNVRVFFPLRKFIFIKCGSVFAHLTLCLIFMQRQQTLTLSV